MDAALKWRKWQFQTRLPQAPLSVMACRPTGVGGSTGIKTRQTEMFPFRRGVSSPCRHNEKRDLAEAGEFLHWGQLQVLRFGRQKELNVRSDNFLLVCRGHKIAQPSPVRLDRSFMRVFRRFGNEICKNQHLPTSQDSFKSLCRKYLWAPTRDRNLPHTRLPVRPEWHLFKPNECES